MSNKKRRTSDAVDILLRMAGDDPELRQMIQEESLNAWIACRIYELRTAADITQQQLAELAGTTQPVIARLEDANYEGHSLSMLVRIARALGKRLQVDFVDRAERSDKASEKQAETECRLAFA
jgi:DNA-binding XRE family transcriptional regulator